MARSSKYNDLTDHYLSLFRTMELNVVDFLNPIVDTIVSNKKRYQKITDDVGVPWWFFGLIHYRESSFSFNRHFHNGDPLSNRTVRVPAGRPINGSPPFTFEESATDSLLYKRMDREHRWYLLSRVLWLLERYNGFGYILYHPSVLSPYLWNFSNHYTKGGYSHDGKFDYNYVSGQAGCAPLIRILMDRGIVKFSDFCEEPTHIRPITCEKEEAIKQLEKVLGK